MAVKQSTTENDEKLPKLPISRILEFISENEQRTPLIIQDYTNIGNLLRLLGYIEQPEKPDELKQFKNQIAIIDEYLRKISEHVDITAICSSGLHDILQMDNPSGAAGIILHRLESVRMPKFFAIFTEEPQLKKALNNLFSWLKYTYFIRNLDRWILKAFSDLQENKMYSILLDISSSQIMQIVYMMMLPYSQKQTEPIFFKLLTSVQHTSLIFDKVKKCLPNILSSLGKDLALQQKYVDATKALIEHFNTFPDHQDYSHLDSIIAKNYTVSSNYKQQIETAPWHDTSPSYQYISTNARVGLENLGNTCYMNSILQALALTKHFRQEMLNIEIESNLFNLLQRLLALLLHSRRPTLSPDMILKVACPPAFHEGHQQDCSEFLGHLLETLHSQEKSFRNSLPESNQLGSTSTASSFSETMTGTDDGATGNLSDSGCSPAAICDGEVAKTLIQKTFDGSITIACKCLNCGTTSKQNDSFRDLHLSFPDMETSSKCQYSVEDLLEYYCSMERLDADNKYFCNICKMLCDGERLIKIVKPPRYLVLTLKYFKYDKKINMRTKLTHNVNHNPKIRVKVSPDDGANEYCVRYRLYAAVVHSGVSMDSGHYYTYGSDQPDGSWYKFNDSFVTECNIAALKSLRSPNTPYVLFYEREDDCDLVQHDALPVAGQPQPSNGNMYDELPLRLRSYVDKENSRYEMEKRLRQPKVNGSNHLGSSFSSRNDNDDPPPPSSCGGNSFASANHYIC